MLKKVTILVTIISIVFTSCAKKSELAQILDCDASNYNNLETVEDVKSLFSIDLPKHWKINLYQDEVQSSIFAADTTKQLTETVLLDVTYIKNKINFDEAFLLKQEQENLSKNLITLTSKEFTFQEKPALYQHCKGKKGEFLYQAYHTFIKIDDSHLIFAKTEVYGDSLVNQRFCKAFSLLNNIKFKN